MRVGFVAAALMTCGALALGIAAPATEPSSPVTAVTPVSGLYADMEPAAFLRTQRSTAPASMPPPSKWRIGDPTPVADVSASQRKRATNAYTPIATSEQGVPVGWALCAAPVTYTLDLSAVLKSRRDSVAADVRWAFAWWARVTSLPVTEANDIPLTLDGEQGVAGPVDQVLRPRHVYLMAARDATVNAFDGKVVGLAGPTHQVADQPLVYDSSVVLSAEYLARASHTESRAVILHELGHAFGLGHSKERLNIMFPYVSENDWLGPGDVNGVYRVSHPCPDGTPASETDVHQAVGRWVARH